jgi:hypothetical protein
MGEVLLALRKHLILPSDVGDGNCSRCMLRIMQPKTRWKFAVTQIAKTEEWWVIKLLESIYSQAAPLSKLWPMSPSSFRGRWNKAMSALGVPFDEINGVTPGGLRGGGATALWEMTEDVPRVRRRGRWLRDITVEIYVQEVAHADLLMSLPRQVRARLDHLSAALPNVLQTSFNLLNSKIPTSLWYAYYNT